MDTPPRERTLTVPLVSDSVTPVVTPIKQHGCTTPSTASTSGSPLAPVAWPAAQGASSPVACRPDLEGGPAMLQEETEAPEHFPTWEAFCAVVPLFAGYACLFTLQHEVKAKYGIADDTSARSQVFSSCVSCLYIFNLIFRFAHNVVFGFLSTRSRVLICFACMIAAMGILGGCVFVLGSTWMGWIVLAYALGGTAVGTFEANMLGLLTPYGDSTKRWAVTAIPFGITLITIGAFLVLQAGIRCEVLYLIVACLCACGFAIVMFRIPERKGSSVAGSIVSDLKAWREWLPQMRTLPPCMMLDMFGVSTFCPGILLFIYDQPTVTMFGQPMSSRVFFALYDTTTFFGGAIGRYMAYRVQRRIHPVFFSGLTVLGVVLLCTKTPEVAPFAGFLVLLADGSIYGHTCRIIDHKVPQKYVLVATSAWLFVGDIGSVVGSNVLFYLRTMIVNGA